MGRCNEGVFTYVDLYVAGGRGSRAVLSGRARKYVPVVLGVRHPCLSTVLTRPLVNHALFVSLGGVEFYRPLGGLLQDRDEALLERLLRRD